MSSSRPLLPLAVALALIAAPAAATTQCPRDTLEATAPTVNFRVDNDLFGGAGQDQGYTNGFGLILVSPNLRDYTDDPCLPRLARTVNRALTWLQPNSDFTQRNMTFAIGQALFTPTDKTRRDLIENDRPYAGLLLMNIGYNARNDERLRTTQLTLGLIGPSAQGKQVQDAVHELLGDAKFQGWDNQLHDEPVFRVLHERLRRWSGDGSRDGWGWDAISHWGGALGTLDTHANAGMELRLGWKLPDDFGSSPLRPAGENVAPPASSVGSGWSAHLFVTSDGRWVLRDITLDGNTFRDSHSVKKRPFVGDAGIGLAVMRGKWKFALARYWRTREFDLQRQTPVFGSFTVSRRL
ncbi:lipid A deacylase LpxR family protein [Xanthomonas sp. PPL139]|uniref:lipid A deacylase LpxR family protein n=1 Tax=unclassified Xanthomonas TaxID=2643310 RepID=UPI0033BF2CB4